MNQRVVKTFIQRVQILPTRDQKMLGIVKAIQSFLGLLELIGVALLGTIAIRGVQSKATGERTVYKNE